MAGDSTILHVDMDAFYASVEQRDNPGLRGKPLIVGSSPDRRGVVSACSYEARHFGIHSAMPSREAARLCPQAIFVPVDMPRYQAVSQQIFKIFDRFTPLVEPLSVDEAFLDVTGARTIFGTGQEIARNIQRTLADELHLPASVGIAGNKFLAKLCSELAKPNGIKEAPRRRGDIIDFLAALPVGRLWGVGKVLRRELEARGIFTVGDLQRTERSLLGQIAGRHVAEHLLQLAFGEDPREVEPHRREISISREMTFESDCSDHGRLRVVLRDLCDDVGRRLRAHGRYATVGRIKLRWDSFETITRQKQFPRPSCDDISLRNLALELLADERITQPVRLIGFGVSGLVDERNLQPDLFEMVVDDTERREKLSRAVDGLREKLGVDIIKRADADLS